MSIDQKLHYVCMGTMLVRRAGKLSWYCPDCNATGKSRNVRKTCPKCKNKPAPTGKEKKIKKNIRMAKTHLSSSAAMCSDTSALGKLYCINSAMTYLIDAGRLIEEMEEGGR